MTQVFDNSKIIDMDVLLIIVLRLMCAVVQDDDMEDGEIKEAGNKKPFQRPMCRFFMRGNCTWGFNCRFIHPGINDKGLFHSHDYHSIYIQICIE